MYRTRYNDDRKLDPKQQTAAGTHLQADTTDSDAQVHIGHDQSSADRPVTKAPGKADNGNHSDKKLFGAVRTLQVRFKEARAVCTTTSVSHVLNAAAEMALQNTAQVNSWNGK